MRKPCVIPDCDRLSKARGLCVQHWQREKAAGRLGEFPTKPMTAILCGHPDAKHNGKGLCRNCYMREWQRKNGNSGLRWLRAHPVEAKLHRRRAVLRRFHGITLEAYEAMWQKQGGKCANPRCSYEAPLMVADFRRAGLQVDHDHLTDVRRGLLCRECNQALGHIRDDRDRLMGLIEYLAPALTPGVKSLDEAND